MNWRTRFIGKNVLITHDPSVLKALLSSTNIGHLERELPFYKNVSVGSLVNGLILLSAKRWTFHRKVLNSLFTYDALKSYVKIYEKHAHRLVGMLGTNILISEDESCGSFDNTSYTTLISTTCVNIISEILTGVSFDTLLGHSGALKFHEDVKQLMTINGNKVDAEPWMQIPIFWYFHPQKRKLDEHIDSIEAAIKQIRKSHLPQPESKFALDLMINLNWSDSEIIAELMTLIIGGHETVSNTFKFLLWMLALEEDHQAACQMEVDQVFDTVENSGVHMTMSDFTSMKYLERCIKETLRLFPAITFGTIRNIQNPLIIDENMILPPGTVIMYSSFLLHRDPIIYPDPEKLDPDRFTQENVKGRHSYAYLPFSAGQRNCIGWKSALLELTILSAVVIRNFKLTTTDKREDIRILPKIVLHTSKEPKIVFQRRRQL